LNKGKTDNSYIDIKRELREQIIKQLKYKKVLDCFCESEIWKDIKKDSYIGIDQKKTKDINLHGDNRKYLKELNLEQFNIIDLDAYGIPIKQLEIIFQNNTLQIGTIIFFTFIQSIFGKLPKQLLKIYGYTEQMIKKIPILFNRNGLEKFKYFLAINGIKEIYYIQIDNKTYGYFIVDKMEKKDYN